MLQRWPINKAPQNETHSGKRFDSHDKKNKF